MATKRASCLLPSPSLTVCINNAVVRTTGGAVCVIFSALTAVLTRAGSPHAPPCPMNALFNTSVRTVIFLGPNGKVGLGSELIRYRTACPTNSPIRTIFFEYCSVDRGGAGHQSWTAQYRLCLLCALGKVLRTLRVLCADVMAHGPWE